MKVKFNVIGMSCSACSNHIEKIVSKQKGVNSVNVSLINNNMIVDFDKKIITEQEIIKAVQSIGYDANTKGGQNKSNLDKMRNKSNMTNRSWTHYKRNYKKLLKIVK